MTWMGAGTTKSYAWSAHRVRVPSSINSSANPPGEQPRRLGCSIVGRSAEAITYPTASGVRAAAAVRGTAPALGLVDQLRDQRDAAHRHSRMRGPRRRECEYGRLPRRRGMRPGAAAAFRPVDLLGRYLPAHRRSRGTTVSRGQRGAFRGSSLRT
jgi:hypothetical protein